MGPGGTYATIQAAVDAAQPGWTIVVEDGTYAENVCIGKGPLHQTPTPNGDKDNRIILKARNRWGAKIRPPSGAAAGVGGGGAEYWTVDGFDVACGADGAAGGTDAIAFTNNGTQLYSAAGSPYSDPIRGITIRNCKALTTQLGKDPIHIAGGYDVHVTDNICTAANDQGIDFGGISGGTIARNIISNIAGGAAAIVVKLGSINIAITDNVIQTTSTGISVGDVSGDIMPNPDNWQSEARFITLSGNAIEVVSGTSSLIKFVGAWDCSETGTTATFAAARGNANDIRVTSEAANVGAGRPQIFSQRTAISFVSSHIQIDAGNS